MVPTLPDPVELRAEFAAQQHVIVPNALPPSITLRWRQQAEAVSQCARSISRRGEGAELVYRVVTGEQIRAQWPELYELYSCRELREWIQAVTGEKRIFVSSHLTSGLNLNVMQGANSVYRWHFDAVPYTALLYLTDVEPEDGGALEVISCAQDGHVPDVQKSNIRRIWPKAGMFILMDGTHCYHRVAPIVRPALRLSIPMVFPREAAERPSGLDTYLYDSAA